MPFNYNDDTGPGMAPTLCSRCGDAVDEGCDPKDELAELDTLLKHLRLKRYELKRKINRSHSAIIRHLPPDVMSTIFEFCLPYFTDDYNHFLAFIREDFSFPLSLGAICSYWRDIAWSMPSLWSSLVARVRSNNDPHIIAGVAQEWLARSGQLPLSIRILDLTINQSQHCMISLIDIPPVGPILTSACFQTAFSNFMRSATTPLHLNPFDFTLFTMR